MAKQKKVLLNLDQELYDPMAESAKVGGLSITEYIRDAIKAKLKGPSPAREPNLLDEPPFDPTPTYGSYGYGEPVQTPDKTPLNYWLERVKLWRTMDSKAAYAAMLNETEGKQPPASAFSDMNTLAQWIVDNTVWRGNE